MLATAFCGLAVRLLSFVVFSGMDICTRIGNGSVFGCAASRKTSEFFPHVERLRTSSPEADNLKVAFR